MLPHHLGLSQPDEYKGFACLCYVSCLLYGFLVCALANPEGFVVSQAIKICNLHGKGRGPRECAFAIALDAILDKLVLWCSRGPTFSQLSLTFLPGMIHVTPET